MRGAGPTLHPSRRGEEQEEAEEGGDGGGGLEVEAGHRAEQEHRALQQGDQAPQVCIASCQVQNDILTSSV